MQSAIAAWRNGVRLNGMLIFLFGIAKLGVQEMESVRNTVRSRLDKSLKCACCNRLHRSSISSRIHPTNFCCSASCPHWNCPLTFTVHWSSLSQPIKGRFHASQNFFTKRRGNFDCLSAYPSEEMTFTFCTARPAVIVCPGGAYTSLSDREAAPPGA